MCGIIGIISKDKKLVKELTYYLLKQSQIRGKHATGISFFKEGKLTTIKEPIPAEEFIKILPEDLGEKVIGHVRYSTSNIEYNQPLTKENTSLVHNGVITQALFEKWSELYGIKEFETKNDSEILLHYIKEEKDLNFHNSSIAAGFFHNNELYCFRNGQRPLYLFGNEEVIGFGSTKNIIERAFKNAGYYKEYHLLECEPLLFYNLYITKDGRLNVLSFYKFEYDKIEDYQYNPVRGYKYLREGMVGT